MPELSPGRQAVLLLSVFAFALLLRWRIADIPLERDEGEYAYIAQHWLQGEPPYKESFDQKPPGAFAAYALILTSFGSSPAAIHWGAQCYTLGTISLLFLAGRRLFSAEVGLLAGTFLAFTMADVSVLGNAANTETFMVLPLVGAFLTAVLAVERQCWGWALACGALSAGAIFCKQVAVPNLLFHFLLIAWAGRPRAPLVAGLVAGALAVLLPAIGYFFWARALPEFWDCAVGHNLAYASRVMPSEYLENFLQTFTYILCQLGPVFVLAAVGMVMASLPRRPFTNLRLPPPRWLVTAWLLFSFLGVCIGGYFRHHYFVQILPPIALLAGHGTAALARKLTWIGPRIFTDLSLIGLALIPGIAMADWYYGTWTAEDKCRQIYGDHPFAESLEVARSIAGQSTPDQPIFVFGSEPQIYFYAKRKSASRYIFVYPVMTTFYGTRDRQRAIVEELHRHPPRFIVMVNRDDSFLSDEGTPNDLETALHDLLQHSYELTGIVRPGADDRMRLVKADADDLGKESNAWLSKTDNHSMTLWKQVRAFPEGWNP
jgi:hypothetical protein